MTMRDERASSCGDGSVGGAGDGHREARQAIKALWMAAAIGATALSPSPSRADECQPASELSTCLAADTAWPVPGDGRWFRIGPTGTVPPGSVAFGLVASYVSRPIGLEVASPDPEGTTIWAVDNALTATYLMAVGLGSRAQIGVAAPVVLVQDGAGVADLEGSAELLPRSAVGDPRLGVTATVLSRERGADGPALAGRFEMSVPVGDETAFVSSGRPVYLPGLVYDHRIGRVHVGVDLRARLRNTRKLAGARIGSQLGATAGVMVDVLADDWLALGGEASLLGTVVEQQELTWDESRLERVAKPSEHLHLPAEWLVSVRSAGLLDGRLVTSLGGGSFIPTGSESAVTVPRFRFMLGIRYVPHDDAPATATTAAETPPATE